LKAPSPEPLLLCRYVETFRLQQERAAGRPLFLKMGDIWGKEGLLLLMLSKLKKTMKVRKLLPNLFRDASMDAVHKKMHLQGWQPKTGDSNARRG
jgi:hypothetical protein